MRSPDAETILYGTGAFLGIIATIYFGQEFILSLSPTIKSIILVTATGAFLTAGATRDQHPINTILYVFAAASYIVFLIYTTRTFTLTPDHIFLLLAASSILFIALGRLAQDGRLDLTRRQARRGLLAAGAVVLLLILLDVTAPPVQYTAMFEDTAVVDQDTEQVIGTLSVTNDFVFSQIPDTPQYRGCLYLDDLPADFHDPYLRVGVSPDTPDEYRRYIPGRTDDTHDITARLRIVPNENITVPDTVPVVERDDCPADYDTPALVVVEDLGDTRVVRREP